MEFPTHKKRLANNRLWRVDLVNTGYSIQDIVTTVITISICTKMRFETNSRKVCTLLMN